MEASKFSRFGENKLTGGGGAGAGDQVVRINR